MMGRKVIFCLVLCSLALTGCIRLTDEFGREVDLRYSNEDGFRSFAATELPPPNNVFKALVKGSIYESGEFMSVFGTCLDGEDNPVNGTYALFSAWYPNGTQFIFNQSMADVLGSPGYYLHNSYMENVQGTYLTSMECRITGDPVTKALAFGEWQNPYWVYRLELLNGTLTDISNDIERGFNITWDRLDQINATLNQSFYDLNQSIYYVATVANASVDRNDSYLALLIQNLTGIINVNNTGNSLDYDIITESNKVYMKGWTIKIRAKDDDGQTIRYPESMCYITTSQTPITLMDVQGEHWKYTETILSLTHTHTITCQYA